MGAGTSQDKQIADPSAVADGLVVHAAAAGAGAHDDSYAEKHARQRRLRALSVRLKPEPADATQTIENLTPQMTFTKPPIFTREELFALADYTVSSAEYQAWALGKSKRRPHFLNVMERIFETKAPNLWKGGKLYRGMKAIDLRPRIRVGKWRRPNEIEIQREYEYEVPKNPTLRNLRMNATDFTRLVANGVVQEMTLSEWRSLGNVSHLQSKEQLLRLIGSYATAAERQDRWPKLVADVAAGNELEMPMVVRAPLTSTLLSGHTRGTLTFLEHQNNPEGKPTIQVLVLHVGFPAGLGLDELPPAGQSDPPALPIWPAPMSTSIAASVARRFARRGAHSDCCLYRGQVPRKTAFLSLEAFTREPNECEILLPPGTIITNVRRASDVANASVKVFDCCFDTPDYFASTRRQMTPSALLSVIYDFSRGYWPGPDFWDQQIYEGLGMSDDFRIDTKSQFMDPCDSLVKVVFRESLRDPGSLVARLVHRKKLSCFRYVEEDNIVDLETRTAAFIFLQLAYGMIVDPRVVQPVRIYGQTLRPRQWPTNYRQVSLATKKFVEQLFSEQPAPGLASTGSKRRRRPQSPEAGGMGVVSFNILWNMSTTPQNLVRTKDAIVEILDTVDRPQVLLCLQEVPSRRTTPRKSDAGREMKRILFMLKTAAIQNGKYDFDVTSVSLTPLVEETGRGGVMTVLLTRPGAESKFHMMESRATSYWSRASGGDAVLVPGRIILLTLLKNFQTGKVVAVINLHAPNIYAGEQIDELVGSGGDDPHGRISLMLLRSIERFLYSQPATIRTVLQRRSTDLILCGDFNTYDNGTWIEYLSENFRPRKYQTIIPSDPKYRTCCWKVQEVVAGTPGLVQDDMRHRHPSDVIVYASDSHHMSAVEFNDMWNDNPQGPASDHLPVAGTIDSGDAARQSRRRRRD